MRLKRSMGLLGCYTQPGSIRPGDWALAVAEIDWDFLETILDFNLQKGFINLTKTNTNQTIGYGHTAVVAPLVIQPKT